MLRPTKSFLRADDLQFLGGEFRRVLAGIVEEAVGVFALQHDAEQARIQFARRHLGGADIFRRIERRHAGRDVFGRADFGAGAAVRADRLHGEAMAEHDVVPRLVQFGRRQLEAGRVDAPAIAEIEETSGFVEREDVFDAVGQALGDIAGVIRERL